MGSPPALDRPTPSRKFVTHGGQSVTGRIQFVGMTTNTPTPTDEQLAVVDLFATGRSMVLEAGAGCGKTSTLRMIASSDPGARGLYVAFNKAIVTDGAQVMPRSVHCSTAHSLAYRDVGAQFRDRLGGPRMKSAEIAKILGIDPVMVQAPSGPKRLAPGYLGGHVLRAVTLFCQSADREPAEKHFPYIEGIDGMTGDGRRKWDNNRIVAQSCVRALRKAWVDVQSPTGRLPFNHGNYLKIWQLAGPRLPFDYVMLDEAQDTAPVLAAVIEDQATYGTQLCLVGDAQQAIYGWAGAIDAMAKFGTDHRLFLTNSFRFGPEIAAVANRVLGLLAADLRITGAGQPGTVGRLTSADVYLTRSNATGVRRAMNELRAGGQPAIVGGADDVVRFAKACDDLRSQGWTAHPELACFKSWLEVQEYVSEDANGADLALMVRLVDEFGADIIIDSLTQCCHERDATLIVSTAHKSKGREWDRVQLADDFPTGMGKDGPVETPGEELRLLYVAATRARRHLDTGGNPLLGQVLEPAVGGQPVAGSTGGRA